MPWTVQRRCPQQVTTEQRLGFTAQEAVVPEGGGVGRGGAGRDRGRQRGGFLMEPVSCHCAHSTVCLLERSLWLRGKGASTRWWEELGRSGRSAGRGLGAGMLLGPGDKGGRL